MTPNTCLTGIPVSQISIRSPLRSDVFELVDNLRQMRQLTPKLS